MAVPLVSNGGGCVRAVSTGCALPGDCSFEWVESCCSHPGKLSKGGL